MLARLVIAWGSLLVIGLLSPTLVPFGTVFLLPFALLAVWSWLSCLGRLRHPEGVPHPVVLVVVWIQAIIGAVLLPYTVASYGLFMRVELIELNRRILELTYRPVSIGLALWGPLMSRLGPRLPGWLAVWLAELALMAMAYRLRAKLTWGTFLILIGAFATIPLLIPFLFLLLGMQPSGT